MGFEIPSQDKSSIGGLEDEGGAEDRQMECEDAGEEGGEGISAGQEIDTRSEPEDRKESHENVSPATEEVPDKKSFKERPSEGFFKDFDDQQLLEIREKIREDQRMAVYYDLVKKRLLEENGLKSIHRGHILNELYQILSPSKGSEKNMAHQLELFALLSKQESEWKKINAGEEGWRGASVKQEVGARVEPEDREVSWEQTRVEMEEDWKNLKDVGDYLRQYRPSGVNDNQLVRLNERFPDKKSWEVKVKRSSGEIEDGWEISGFERRLTSGDTVIVKKEISGGRKLVKKVPIEKLTQWNQ